MPVANEPTYAELEAEVARLRDKLIHANAYIARLQATVNDLMRREDAPTVEDTP